MEHAKAITKHINDTVCAPDGLLHGICKNSTKTGNEIMLAIIALLVHYLFPLAIIVSIIVFLVSNGATVLFITWLSYLNPLIMLALIPVAVIDVTVAIIFIVAVAVITIVYWIYFFREIGVFALLPIAAWLAGFIAGFIPYVGGMISILISITPWMAIAVAIKWIAYHKGPLITIPI